MILPIVIYGDPVLRKKGRRIEKINADIRSLAADMIETMHHAEGVGLAAQQVGFDLQICVIDIPEGIDRPSRMWIKDKEVNHLEHMPMVLINPSITFTKKKEIGPEGCLSFPGISADISRGYRTSVTAQGLDGKIIEFDAAGLLGRAVQHEVDHLNGILFIDRMDPADRAELREDIESVRQEPKKG